MIRRLRRRGDDGSMPLALLLSLVMITSSAAVVPLLLEQLSTTRSDEQRAGALGEARSGLEAATAQIRSAEDSLGTGLLSQLPCSLLSGSSGAVAANTYQVTISYFLTDPLGRADSWLTANKLSCIVGTGLSAIPGFALLQARGKDLTTVRTLTGTYRFRTTNANVAGGQIRSNSSVSLCMDAGSATPSNGAAVTMRTCDPASKSQRFSYNTDLTISLVSSMTSAMPFGMCLDAGASPVLKDPVKMQPCAAPLTPRQQWSYAEAGRFSGTSDGKTLNNFCFNVATPNTVSALIIGGTSDGTCGTVDDGAFDSRQTFFPDPTTGAGSAGSDNGQLMNFGQFSRCLDVTWRNVNMTYLMVWPCKQAPDPAQVYWNQKWVTPVPAAGAVTATGMIWTVPPGGGNYCMRTPNSSAAGQYVRTVSCPGIATQDYSWTVVRDTGDYTTSYRIIDGYGNCLAAADQNAVPTDFVPIGDRIAKMVVRPCSASTLQKWNAPAYLTPPSPLKNISEK